MKLTEPMRIVLLNAQYNNGVVSNIYSIGQMRLIKSGLERRGLIELVDNYGIGRYKLTRKGRAYK